MGERPILLDGGAGRELQRRGLVPPRTIWSGWALLEHPEAGPAMAVFGYHGSLLARRDVVARGEVEVRHRHIEDLSELGGADGQGIAPAHG